MTRWVVPALVVLARVAHAQEADDKAKSTQMFERGRLDVVQRDDYATACDLFAHSYELDPAPGTALNLGDCNEHLGHLTHAMKWFQRAEQSFAAAHDTEREAFAHARAEAVRARLAASAPVARDRTGWRISLWVSAATAVAGTALWIYGYNQVQDATDKLCAGGAYWQTNPSCPIPAMPLTQSQVATLNAQGMHGRDLSVIGGGTAFLATAAAAVSLYEGYLRPDPKRGHDIVIAPTLGAGTAGAVISGAW
jgi:tetratricopeptide (TPR) repeat protein